MTLVDSSVWIDYVNGVATPETEHLDRLLGTRPLAVGDLILTEVLQGFRHDRDYQAAKKLLTSFPVIQMGGQDLAIKAAENFRALRTRGVTVRKTIDTPIATVCIDVGRILLHSDRHFDPFQTHLGLRVAL